MESAPPNKHQQKTQATKKKLLNSALRIFSKQGFEAASIDDIAKRAGHTRGAFYAHFSTKEDLFFALIEQRTADDLAQLRKRMHDASDDSKRIELLRDLYASRITDRQWSLLMLDFKLYAARRGKMRARLAQRFRTLREQIRYQYLRDLLPNGLLGISDEDDRKHIILEALLDGLALKRAYEPSVFSDETAEQVLRNLFDAVCLGRPL